MTLQEFANLAEIVGAFAVVVSLVYLAIQVRQNTVQMRENSKIARLLLQENFVSGQETFFRTMLENENAHRVWDLGYSAKEEIPSEKTFCRPRKVPQEVKRPAADLPTEQ